ncbi:uncharacterized protein SCHCODRAFT_02488819 [Schizophyllum commune H4-8]|nr:uncharacterized protein SCHCODRAFT_02488819 [Schizophyllum commune H4-8]KAI5897354.1 hypothetical protein SCHCODRAFT_02488819 [Schizophyllum commune H4-8]
MRSSASAMNTLCTSALKSRPLLSAVACALVIQLSSLPKTAAFEVCSDGQIANACDHSGPTFSSDGFDKIPIIIGVVVGVFFLLFIAAGTFAFYRWRRIRRFQEEYRRRAQEGLRAENAAYGPPYAGGPAFTGGTAGQIHMMSGQPALITTHHAAMSLHTMGSPPTPMMSPPTTTRSWFGTSAYEPVGQPADAYHPHVGGFGGMDSFHHGGMQLHDYSTGGGMGHSSGGMGMSSSSGI